MRMVSALAAAIVAVSLASCERRETEDVSGSDANLVNYYAMVIGWQDRDIKHLHETDDGGNGRYRAELLQEYCGMRSQWIMMRDDVPGDNPTTMSAEATRLHLEVNEICQEYVTN